MSVTRLLSARRPAGLFALTTLTALAAATLGGCAVTVNGDGHGDMHMDMGPGKMAVATLSPAASGGASGLVMFHKMDDHLMVHVMASGLAPGSVHGFHVHDKGSCASADFTSAGGHFNPEAKAHGTQDGEHHAGDMPNLTADAEGKVDQKFHLHGATLTGANSLVGHAVIIHAGQDDYQTQPTGNSGARIACGVIAAHNH